MLQILCQGVNSSLQQRSGGVTGFTPSGSRGFIYQGFASPSTNNACPLLLPRVSCIILQGPNPHPGLRAPAMGKDNPSCMLLCSQPQWGDPCPTGPQHCRESSPPTSHDHSCLLDSPDQENATQTHRGGTAVFFKGPFLEEFCSGAETWVFSRRKHLASVCAIRDSCPQQV